MNMKQIDGLAAGLCLLAATHCGAQSKQWDKRYGGTLGDFDGVILPTSDGGYIQGGSCFSGATGDKTQASQGGYDFWVVKMDANGTKQWDRRFGGAGHEYLYSILQMSDGGYLLGGESMSGASGDKTQNSRGGLDYWIVKIDAAGSKLWDRRFGGLGNERGAYVQPAADGGWFLGGHSDSPAGGDKSENPRGAIDYWLVKVDASGNMQWDRRFGGAGADYGRGICATADGGCLIGGKSESGAGFDKTEASRGGADYWIVKVDASGNKQWDRRFGGSADENMSGLCGAPDGGFLLGGYTGSPADGDKTEASRGDLDYWVVKVNARGAKQWDRRFGGSGNEYGGEVASTADGGFIVGGYAGSPANGDVTESSRGLMDYWVVKLDAQGSKRWDKRLGGAAQDYLYSVAQTAGGGYILGGESESGADHDKTESTRGNADYWAVKLAGWPADAYEPDDSQETAKTITGGQVQNHSIHEVRDVDWTKFTVTAPGAVNARIETAGAAGDTLMLVYYGIRGPLVGGNDDIGGANKFSRVTIPALLPGTYYIQTVAYGNNVALPAYTLAANWTQNYEPDAYESDNGRSAARRIRNGRVQNRSIHAAGNRDWAKFTIAAGGARDVRIETRGASGDTRIRLYNRRLKRLAQDDDSGPGLFSRIRRSSLPAGTYYVRIQEKGDDGTIGAYTLKVRWTQR